MVLTVPAIMHDDKPHMVRRDSKFLSASIFSDGISFAIAVSHRDRLWRSRPLAGGLSNSILFKFPAAFLNIHR
jgi:hypothetical protein